ncbi:DUF3156 family protein [Desulfovibrio caledoniensis]
MFRSRRKRVNAANEAILHTSRLFAGLWGDAELTEDGDVRFSNLPNTLQGLMAVQTWQRQLLGGTMSVNLRLEREVESTQHCVLHFSNGRFRCKGRSDKAQSLLDRLHADTLLMTELRQLDLGGLTISISGGKATVALTPYGGGLAFLALPPLQYHVAYPPDQVGMTARALERLERIINSESETLGVAH